MENSPLNPSHLFRWMFDTLLEAVGALGTAAAIVLYLAAVLTSIAAIVRA